MSEIPDDIAAELAALADGTLDGARTARLMREVESSPTLGAALADQERALASVALAVHVSAPASLREAVARSASEAGTDATDSELAEATRLGVGWQPAAEVDARGGSSADASEGTRRTPRRRGLRLRSRLAVVGLCLAAVALLAALLLVHPAKPAPSIASIVALTQRSAQGPARAEPPGSDKLVASVEGLHFPYWASRYGWFANGERTGEVEGRSATIVYYRSASERLGYAIVGGAPLSVSGGQTVSQDGVSYRLLEVAGIPTIVWRRNGHSCVIGGRGLKDATLLALASWQDNDA